MPTEDEKSRPGIREMAAAFSEWERRRRANPDLFEDPEGECEAYGEVAARYLTSILDEQRAGREAA